MLVTLCRAVLMKESLAAAGFKPPLQRLYESWDNYNVFSELQTPN
jgi:hypothetical protein